MSQAFAKTHSSIGVRTLSGATAPPSMRPRGRRGYVVLGASSDLVNLLIAQGNDPALVQQIVDLGATDEQLNYWATGTMSYPQIIAQLTGGELPNETPISSSTGTASTDIGALQSQANDLVGRVQSMQADLSQMTQQALAAMKAGTPWPAAAGSALNQQQRDLNDIVSKVNFVYRAAFGTTAPGLSGLGVDPVTIASAVALVAVILAAMALWWQHEQNLKAQIAVQATQAQTQQQVAGAATTQAQQLSREADVYDQQADLAAAQGNSTAAASLHAQATALRSQATSLITQATNASGGATAAQIGQFFQQNWPWFAVGAGALILLPNLTGRRR